MITKERPAGVRACLKAKWRVGGIAFASTPIVERNSLSLTNDDLVRIIYAYFVLPKALGAMR